MECKGSIPCFFTALTLTSGRFRWVYCQLDYLGKCLPGRIRHTLDELPKSLDETYERTLREIHETNWECARQLLQCVSVTSRPVRVEELASFLAFDFTAGQIPHFREDWCLEDPLEAVLSTCSTLLAVVIDDDSQVVQFSHFSVKEFLTSTRFAERRDTISCRYYISMTPAHTIVAQACLGILLHLDEDITKDKLENFPLVEYAAEHWIEHARFDGVSQNTEEGMKQLFDGNKLHLAVWVWIHDPIRTWMRYERAEKPTPPVETPLHYAAFCGLHTVVKVLAVDHPQDVHSRNVENNSTPLHRASQEGHVEVARVLIEHGADMTVQDERGSTPLHDASRTGHKELAQFLLEHGADVTAQDKDGSTPLHQASGSGRMKLAQLLVEHNADVTARDKDGSTPLHRAWVIRNLPYSLLSVAPT